MPEPSCPLVIAVSLHDADQLIRELRLPAPRGRVLLGEAMTLLNGATA